MLTRDFRPMPRWGAKVCSATAVVLALRAFPLAPPAHADRAPVVEQAVTAARGSAPCVPLQYSSVVEHAADIANRSTYGYLTHTTENVPADQTHPTAIIKDLGIAASKAISLQGAGHSQADAVKGVLLQGRNDIHDCSYTEFGASLLHEEQSDFILVVVILTGP